VQETPRGRFRLTGEEPDLLLEVEREPEDWRPVYRIDLAEVDQATLETVNTRLGADPDWYFHHHLLVELTPRTGRRMLVDTRLTVEAGEEREVKALQTIAELRETLSTVFGIGLAAIEGLDPVLSRLLAHAEPAP
jgi:arylamine N-acetyltransferase